MLNSSYDSQQSLPPKNKQFSPVITQLMRKDREIEIMRDELSQQNYLIDELSQQVHFLEKQLRNNEDFKEKYQSLSEEFSQPKVKVPLQTTTAQQIMNQFLEKENSNKIEVIDINQLLNLELQESICREFDHKEILAIFMQHCSKMNAKINQKNTEILQLTLIKYDELLNQLFQKEEELLLYKEKNRVFFELLLCNMDLTKLYQKQHQGLRQALKGCWTLNVDQSQQIEQIIKILDQANLQHSSVQVKPILDNLKVQGTGKMMTQLELFINKACPIDGKSPLDKAQRMIVQLEKYKQVCQNIQDEKEEILQELEFYKNKLLEQDETIKEFEKILSEMEDNYHQQLNTQQIQQGEIAQKNELISHYQLILDDYKAQLQQKQEQKSTFEDEKTKELQLEEILKIVTMLLQGYNIQTNDYQLNLDVNGININKKVQLDVNPLINNYVNKIQQSVTSQFMTQGKNYYELTNHMVNCLQLMKQHLPQNQLKFFLNDSSIEYIEKFNQISYCYFIKQEKVTSNEKELYRKYYTYIPRLLGELMESQTQTFIKLLREKVYNNIMCEPITMNKTFQ